jgi:hypothetical protein
MSELFAPFRDKTSLPLLLSLHSERFVMKIYRIWSQKQNEARRTIA